MKMLSAVIVPSAVRKRTHHNRIFGFRIIFFNSFINVEWSSQILRIEPTANSHYCVTDVFKMRQQISFLPELIIIRMIYHLLHKEVVFIIFVHTIFQRSHIFIEKISVVRSRFYHFISKPRFFFRFCFLHAKDRKCFEITH